VNLLQQLVTSKMWENRVDIVVDLETLGTSMNAPVVQIAARVIARPAVMEKLHRHEFNCFICPARAREFAPAEEETWRWWHDNIMSTNPDAYWTAFGRAEKRLEVFGLSVEDVKEPEDRNQFEDVGIYEALSRFSGFYQSCTEDYLFHERKTSRQPLVWGNGAAFDLGILRNLHESWNRAHPEKVVDIPWSFRSERDVRTVYDILGAPSREYLPGETPHIALFDARAEARRLEKCLYG
jgi:hypothetical protein